MDTVSKETRARIMGAVPRSHSKPEVTIRKFLHAAGFRFRLHRRDLPGTPDIVLPRYRVAIFVHGCFWHQHFGCRKARRPTSNVEYWERKLDENLARDRRDYAALEKMGWHPIVVWECELREPIVLQERLGNEICQYRCCGYAVEGN